MTGRRLVLLAPLLLTAAAAAPDPVRELAGRYYKRFPNALVSGEKYTGEDIVEIVPVAKDVAYVRADQSFFNGHMCQIFGVAEAEGDALVYRDPEPGMGGRRCVLTVRRLGRELTLRDNEGGCRTYCGARGGFAGVALPIGSRRPIRYMARLKASEGYRTALKDWKR